MQPKLYVGNLSYNASDDDLHGLFGKYGEIKSAEVIKDKYSGQSKGFGFVEMLNPADAEKALEQNGVEFMGRNLIVSEARPPKERGDFGGGHRGGSRGGGNRGGGGSGRFDRDRKRGGGGGGFNRY